MRVLYYRHESGVTNFGDELNLYLWDKLLPQSGVILRPDLLFLGCGSLLNASLPPNPKLVFGAGTCYGPAPNVHGPNVPGSTWDIRFVRGPLTAERLEIPNSLAITDPAILVGVMHSRSDVAFTKSFMPRFTDADELRQPAEAAGFHFIDPRWQPEKVIQHLRVSGVLVTEALHGAVVADALRVPWIPFIHEENRGHEFKWHDWLATVELPFQPLRTWDLLSRSQTLLQAKLSTPAVFRRLTLRVLKEVDILRTEIKQRMGTFAPANEPKAGSGTDSDIPSAIPVGRPC